MEPHHHRPLRGGIDSGGPHIEVEAILSHRSIVEIDRLFSHQPRGPRLRTARTDFHCLTYAAPRLWLLRRHEAIGAIGPRSVRNALEDPERPVGKSRHLAGRRFD